MRRAIGMLATLALCAVAPAYAMYSVSSKGEWPKTWPQELEPLRKQSRTFEGPIAPHRHHAIPFTGREEAESAWPRILKVKTKGAPVFLVRAPNFFLGEKVKAGVIVHCPPAGQSVDEATAGTKIPGQTNARAAWMNATFIELAVDGEVVDLNRLPLPADTPIIDERFKDQDKR